MRALRERLRSAALIVVEDGITSCPSISIASSRVDSFVQLVSHARVSP